LTLGVEEQREVRQLLFVARYYLRQASAAKKERLRRLGDTAADFKAGVRPTRKTRRLALVAAHLSSAAVRLATIEKVLSASRSPTDTYKACQAFYQKEVSDYPPATDCLHVLLRDSIGHAEPRAGSRWRKRQDDIQELSFATAYDTLATIEGTLRGHLKTKHRITLPAIGR